MNSTDLAIVFVDRALRIKLFTPRARTLFDLIPSDTGRPLLDLTNKLRYAELADDAARVLDTLNVVEREVESSDGLWYIARVLPCRTADDRIAGVVLTFTDIVAEHTRELSDANEALRREIAERIESEETRLRLLRQLVRAQEDERRRISRELHDELGQKVTALGLKLSALKGRSDISEASRTQVASLERIVNDLDADVEFLVWKLRPTGLDDLGLAEALSDYVSDWSLHFEIVTHFEAKLDGRLPAEIETVLYRIAQEALNNVAKHARAKAVDVLLERDADRISLRVQDDGTGFDTAAPLGTKSLGLLSMRERAALVRGTVAIESRPDAGTIVRVTIPV